jgi:fumarate reductase iron-sulfur subunit
MAEVMINKVGIFRNGPELQQAVDELQDCLSDCGRAVLQSKVPGMNPELSDALRLEGMMLAIVIAAALARAESRGAHFHRDFPLRDDCWLKRTLARWPGSEAGSVMSRSASRPSRSAARQGGVDRTQCIHRTVQRTGSGRTECRGTTRERGSARIAYEMGFVEKCDEGSRSEQMTSPEQARRLTVEVFRFNPQDPDAKPRTQQFEIDESPYMTLYIVLTRLREEQDASLQFDFSCRSAVCGSCGMLVNGRPMLACRTLTASLPQHIRLYHCRCSTHQRSFGRHRPLVSRLYSRSSWIHERRPFDPAVPEERMSDDESLAIYESDRCIECGCCVASCGVANLKPGFAGPAGLNRMARFMMDPRDARDDKAWFDVVDGDNGVFGCIGMMPPRCCRRAAAVGFIRCGARSWPVFHLKPLRRTANRSEAKNVPCL